MNKKNKHSNIRIYIIFAFVMISCLVGGFFAGKFTGKNKDILASIDWDKFAFFIANSLPVAYGILIIVSFIVYYFMYKKVKSKALDWQNNFADDEDIINNIEIKIDYISIFSSVTFILSIMIFPLCVWSFIRTDNIYSWQSVLTELTFMMSLILYFIIFKVTVDLEKKLNPEKKGNPFDLHFVKKWELSSDEGEILVEARAGKKAFFIGQIACLAGWIAGFISMLAFNTGVLPVICSSGIFLSMYIAYGFEIVKLKK